MQDFLYNGKEYETTEDLNWYFYGARWYDPAIGRFTGVDPIAAEFAHVSGYNYAENSPIAYIDLWGLQRALPNGQSGPFTDAYADKEWEAANANSSGETLPTYTITENQLPLSERTVGSLTPRQVWGKDAQIYDLGARRQAEYIQAVFNPETVGWAGGMQFFNTRIAYRSGSLNSLNITPSLKWGRNARGHLAKHADALGFPGITPQQGQKMLPQLKEAATKLYRSADPSKIKIGQWHGHTNTLMHPLDNGSMIVTKLNGEYITAIPKTTNKWYRNATYLYP